MKKTAVLTAVSRVRTRCELANSCLRRTANTYDTSISSIRATTEQERLDQIKMAWFWIAEAKHEAGLAANVVLEFAKQNGITVEEIDAYVESLRVRT